MVRDKKRYLGIKLSIPARNFFLLKHQKRAAQTSSETLKNLEKKSPAEGSCNSRAEVSVETLILST